jgi:hypothetical protein
MTAIATVVGAIAIQHSSDTATRTLDMANLVDATTGGAFDCVDGDLLLVWVFYAGGSTTNGPITGLTKYDDNVLTSGATSSLYYKQNLLAASDNTSTFVIPTSTANRTNVIGLIVRGALTSGAPFLGAAKSGIISRAFSNSPILTPSAIGGLRLEFCGTSVTGATPTAYPVPDSGAGLTRVRTGATTGQFGARSTVGTSGDSSGAVAFNNSPMTSGTAGGTLWTPETQTVNGNIVFWTLVVAPIVVATEVRPSGLVAGTGSTVFGGAAGIYQAHADDLDTTGSETTDSPAGLYVEENMPNFSANDVVYLNTRLQTANSASITYLIEIRQSTTVICSHSVVVAFADGVV